MNIKESIKYKLIIMYLGLVLIVMIVSGSYILLRLQNIEEDKAKTQLELYTERINEQVISGGNEDNFQEELLKFSQGGSSISNTQGNIINSQGNTIASTSVVSEPFPQYRNSSVISALAGERCFDIFKRSTDTSGLAKYWISYASPVLDSDGNVKYVIFSRIDASDIKSGLDQTRRTIFIAVFLALALTIFMGYIFAKTITGPILELTSKARLLATGNLNQKVKVKSNDEIGQLTESFNHMSSELDKNIKIISNEKNKLEIILHNMSDGVISYDSLGNLIHVNSVAMDMLEISDFNMSFTEFIKKFDLSSGIYLDINKEPSKKVTFPIGEKFITANFTPYYRDKDIIDGIVVVLQDITEAKKLDDMRKEFVANVSHELRTPLTTVKSYTETLMDGAVLDEEISMEFLGIINNEADRMAFLVRDLLQLSRFDNKQIQLSVTEIDLNSYISETVKQNKIHAEAKEQNLYFIPYDKDVFVYADRDRIGQVINNIITNAIKYSQNKAEIKIFIEEDDNYYKLTVKDTGMGIPKNDLPRIFERFYRVDKARSRAMGGTGLGLAIAKEIMEIHQGKITVESEYGKGTAMTMWFNKNFKGIDDKNLE